MSEAAGATGAAGSGEGAGGVGGEGGAGAGGNDFLSQFPDEETRTYVEGKGWKDTATIVKSTRHLEQMVRGNPDRLVSVPEDSSAPEAWEEFFNKAGRPSTKDDYKLGEVSEADKPLMDFLKETFHGAGLSQTQADKISKGLAEYAGKSEEQSAADYQMQIIQEENSLKKEWGAAYGERMLAAQKGFRVLGIPESAVDALEKEMGYASVMKLMANVAAKMGEDDFLDGGNGNDLTGALTPAQAEHKIAELKSDPQFLARYKAGEELAVKEMGRLHAMAFPSRK